MSDEDILERGGTQEDINRYAHDVGGACGLAYGWTCDYCTTTDNTQELDEILQMFKNELVFPNIEKQYEHLGAMDLYEAKQALIDWHNKQVEEVLDRLESQRLLYAVGSTSGIPMSAIEAERNKLKESK